MPLSALARRAFVRGCAGFIATGLIVTARAETALVDLPRSAVKAGMTDQSVILVDVREADEFAGGHIPGAINMPLSTLDPAQLPQQGGKQVVVYCHSGRRARLAVAKAQAAGRTDITAIYGGSMSDWLAAGETVEK